MQKRSELIIVLSALILSSLSLVSAQAFSISDLMNDIGGENIILFCIFFLVFILINFTMGKSIFKKQPGTSAVIAFLVSILVTYGFVYMDIDVGNFLEGLGFESGVLSIIFMIILIAGMIYGGTKIGYGIMIIALGLLLTILSKTTDIFYEENTVFALGIIIIFIGALWWGISYRTKKNKEKKVLQVKLK